MRAVIQRVTSSSVVVDGKVKVMGRVVSEDEIKKYL